MQATEGSGGRRPPPLLADLELRVPNWRESELWATGWGGDGGGGGGNSGAGPKLALKQPVPLTTAHRRRTRSSVFLSLILTPAVCVDVWEYVLDERAGRAGEKVA